MKSEKTCTKCGETKPVEMFYRQRDKKDGLCCWCKECKNSSVKEYQKTDAWKAVSLKAYRKYVRTEKGKARSKRHAERFPEKRNAYSAVNNAVQCGKLDKPLYCCVDSSECEGQIEGHHWDYSRPLDVTWLCKKHHRWVHQNEASK